MKTIGLVLLAGLLLLLPAPILRAQSEDPSEVFLKAYMTSQQGEKLEHENQWDAALAKFRFAGSLLEQVRKTHADWQPAIVEYRARKISESILRVQGKASTQRDLSAATQTVAPAPPAPATTSRTPILPDNAGAPEPSVEIVTPRAGDARMKVPGGVSSAPLAAIPVNDAAIEEATKRLREKVDQLQTDLQTSRKEYSAVQKEKETLKGQLEETSGKLGQAQTELQKTRGAEKQVRDQLAQAQESLQKIQGTGGDKKAQEALRAEIGQLQKALASAEEGRATAEKEKEATSAQLTEANKEVASVKTERDQLLAELKNAKDAQERVQVLVSENTDLKQKLADAEKTVHAISEDKPKKEQEIADVRRQVEQLRQQLAASQKQNKDFETTVAELRGQLDDASAQLDKAKLTGASSQETTRLTKENELLRGIVVRERQEEARRDQAKKLMLAEFDKLQIKSETLNQQIELLAQPVAKLTDEELALLRQPVVAISDDNPAAVTASFTMAKNEPRSVPKSSPISDASGSNPPGGSGTTPAPNMQVKSAVPDDLASLAREAKQNFDHGKFHAAEKSYQDILAKSPNNLYSLSNLGVVYFRTGKLKAAELTLKKAITLSPKDEFSHTTLGIVFYRQSKFDDALNELTKALAINPKSATAHNYLGITASQKGWQEAAEKEMLDAIAANPDYADAHFNLAVIYATANPPSKELAKRHYAKATSLGAQPDASLEKLIH
ncbi:MAG: tetratricopeptide repeat protein [Chthoniobacterales bacterium]